MSYPEAPLLSSLEPAGGHWEHGGLRYPAGDDRPLGGPLAGLVGPRFTLAEMEDQSDFPEPDGRFAAVRAWPLPGLVGKLVQAPSQAGLSRALGELLVSWCGVTWRVGAPAGPLQKYGILHTPVAAPPDEETGQPLALELYGRVGLDPNSLEAFEGWHVRRGAGESFDDDHPPCKGPSASRCAPRPLPTCSCPELPSRSTCEQPEAAPP